MTAKPSEVWHLQLLWPNDKIDRPYVVVTPVSDEVPGMVIYGSTSPLRKDEYKAECCEISRRAGRNGNGLRAPVTFFYPAKLGFVFAPDLKKRQGVLDALESIRLYRALKRAIGWRQKNRWDADAQSGSWRGELVELAPKSQKDSGFVHGIVLTGHEHSAATYDQVIVPVIHYEPTESDSEEIVVDGRVWRDALGRRTEKVSILPHYIFSVFQPEAPLRRTGVVVNDDTLAVIENAVLARVRLGS